LTSTTYERPGSIAAKAGQPEEAHRWYKVALDTRSVL
jgi:hypothetical protein